VTAVVISSEEASELAVLAGLVAEGVRLPESQARRLRELANLVQSDLERLNAAPRPPVPPLEAHRPIFDQYGNAGDGPTIRLAVVDDRVTGAIDMPLAEVRELVDAVWTFCPPDFPFPLYATVQWPIELDGRTYDLAGDEEAMVWLQYATGMVTWDFDEQGDVWRWEG
jgi:hypothetical protein